MRKLFAILPFLFLYINLWAQDKPLVAEGVSPNLYIVHTLAAKENYYSLGRMYNTSPKELAPYNNLSFDKGLSLGQTIKIPLNAANFSQGEAPKADEVLVPVYHIMQAKEGLFRVSVAYNKVPVDALKKWNKLTGDNVNTGTKLIIGFLKVVKDQSPLAQHAVNIPTEELVTRPAEDKKEDKKNNRPPKTDLKQDNQAVQDKKNTELVTNQNTTRDIVSDNATNKTPVDFAGGKFKKLYNDQTNNRSLVTETGVAAVFKTTSGWQDGKYYCFHNTAEPGTIIKITNNTNGKSIYAKVLDAIPDIKQNTGLLLRVSNAAAEELGAGENKFDCSISYAK